LRDRGGDGQDVSEMTFEQIGEEEIWKGHIGTVKIKQFRHDDADVVEREVIEHPGAAVMLPFDGERIWLVRQPREAVGAQGLLELPAGKLNGEDPLETAKRELREEIGRSAAEWKFLTSFYASPGFTDEEIYAYLATDLEDDPAVVQGVRAPQLVRSWGRSVSRARCPRPSPTCTRRTRTPAASPTGSRACARSRRSQGPSIASAAPTAFDSAAGSWAAAKSSPRILRICMPGRGTRRRSEAPAGPRCASSRVAPGRTRIDFHAVYRLPFGLLGRLADRLPPVRRRAESSMRQEIDSFARFVEHRASS
jgi:ADP-ribose pyrophosphatase